MNWLLSGKAILDPIKTNLAPTQTANSSQIIDEIESTEPASNASTTSDALGGDNGMDFEQIVEPQQQQKMNDTRSSGSTSPHLLTNLFVNNFPRGKRPLTIHSQSIEGIGWSNGVVAC